jgi:hypothetical protein
VCRCLQGLAGGVTWCVRSVECLQMLRNAGLACEPGVECVQMLQDAVLGRWCVVGSTDNPVGSVLLGCFLVAWEGEMVQIAWGVCVVAHPGWDVVCLVSLLSAVVPPLIQ